MSIAETDLKLLAAEVLEDTATGGGRMSAVEVVDGLSNNLFPDISELDRTLGRVALRKAFGAVMTTDQAHLYGAHFIVDQLPRDPNVGVTLFQTGSAQDRRNNAVGRMEAWLARGPKYDGFLWDYHIAGQQSILLVQRMDRELPSVGDTLCLVKEPGSALEDDQFVRITEVSANERSFTVGGKDFTRNIVTLKISEPLAFDLTGGSPHYNDEEGEKKNGFHAAVYNTVIADATRYAGMSRLAEPAQAGVSGGKVESIFAKLVPSAQTEYSIVDRRAHQGSFAPLAAGEVTLQVNNVMNNCYLPSAVLPGSLRATYANGDIVTDRAGKVLKNGAPRGSIDYERGRITDCNMGTCTITYTAAVFGARDCNTAAFEVTPASASSSFVFILEPPPAPGTLCASFMMQNHWYTLRDDGSGALRAHDASIGAGSVNFSTGTVSISCGAVPDMNTSVIVSWSAQTVSTLRTGQAIAATHVIRTDNNESIAPGTVAITWNGGGGSNKSATDNGHGSLTGDAAGEINYAAGEIHFTPNTLPPVGAELNVTWQTGERKEKVFDSPVREANGMLSLQLDEGDILPGTVSVSWQMNIADDTIDTDYTKSYPLPDSPATDAGSGAASGGYLQKSLAQREWERLNMPPPRFAASDIPHA